MSDENKTHEAAGLDAAMEERLAAMLAEAEKKAAKAAAKIIADAQAQAKAVTEEAQAATKAMVEEAAASLAQAAESNAVPDPEATVDAAARERQAYLNEMVEVKLFRDGKRYKAPVTVVVNGKLWRIERGVRVEIPRYVSMVLESSMEQDEAANMYMQQKSGEFAAAAVTHAL